MAKDGEFFNDAPSFVFVDIGPILKRSSGNAKIGQLYFRLRFRG
jgi:hypothetical protein